MTKIFEFLLWDNCNNNCRFCFLKKRSESSAFLLDSEKVCSIQSTIDYLNCGNITSNDDVLICGGELFDTPMNNSVKDSWETLVTLLGNKLKDGGINHLYINTNLIYDINICLIYILSYLNLHKVLDKVTLTTSYDLIGRYKTVADKNLVKTNIKKLKELFPKLDIVVNTILTKQVCHAIMDGEFSIRDFQAQYNIITNIIPYIVYDSSLMPAKSDIESALVLLDKQLPGFFERFVKQMNNDRERVVLKFFNGKLNEITAGTSSCGHSVNFCKYSESNSCFVCDIIKMYDKYCGK